MGLPLDLCNRSGFTKLENYTGFKFGGNVKMYAVLTGWMNIFKKSNLFILTQLETFLLELDKKSIIKTSTLSF